MTNSSSSPADSTTADAGRLWRLLANGVSHRAAARTLKVSEGTIRRAVLQDVALLRSP